MKNNYDNIPDELKALNQWVCANADKVPMKAWCYETASSSNPDTWSDFKTAYESVKNGHYEYLGFVFADNGYVGIDIDDGYDADGFMDSKAAEIIGRCESYTEKSRSGTGFHVILRGNLPFKGRNNLQGVEIYKSVRFFILTGNLVGYRDIIENQSAIDYVVDTYFDRYREPTERDFKLSDTIYTPTWENAIQDGIIRTRPTYPPINNGSRNLSLTSLAGSMHTVGYNKKLIYEELKHVNSIACKPPIKDGELRTICNSITRYRR